MSEGDFVQEYFNAEQLESILFLIIGLVAFCTGLGVYFFYRSKQSLGFMIPLVLISIIQISVGGSIYLRSPDDIDRVLDYYETDLESIGAVEIPRMEEVMINFEIYRWTEIALVVAGLLVLIVLRKNQLIRGICLGLVIQASIMFTLDLFAEARGEEYLQHLKNSIALDP